MYILAQYKQLYQFLPLISVKSTSVNFRPKVTRVENIVPCPHARDLNNVEFGLVVVDSSPCLGNAIVVIVGNFIASDAGEASGCSDVGKTNDGGGVSDGFQL